MGILSSIGSAFGPVGSAIGGFIEGPQSVGNKLAGGYMAAGRAGAKQLKPYSQFGTNALNRASAIYGFDDGTPDYSYFTDSPDYQFAFDQGLNALDRSAAARGSLFSGGQMKAAQQFGQGLASQQLGNYLNRLGGFTNVGLRAAEGIGGIRGDAMRGAAEATAAGRLGRDERVMGLLDFGADILGSFAGGGG